MSTAMARKRKYEYTATADLSLGWSGNRGTWCHSTSGDYDGTAQWAAVRITEMRSAGAASATRTVTMRRRDDWDRDTLKYRCPPILEVSYFDNEQCLTGEEVYAARVHDWHAMTDRHNRLASLGPFEYHAWQCSWGPEPAACAACGAALYPQNFYKYNGEVLVRRDGTQKLLGK